MSTKAPDYTLRNSGVTTQREWKQLKRSQLRDAIREFDNYLFGSAWCPGHDEGLVDEIRDCLHRLKQLHSVKEWGR